MRLLLGKMFRLYNNDVSDYSLEIPGIGILNFNNPNDDEPFTHLELNRKQLVNLKKAIENELTENREEELENERKADLS